MTGIKKGRTPVASFSIAVGVSFFLIAAQACRPPAPISEHQPVTLRIGYGLAPGMSLQSGAVGAARLIALDPLVSVRVDGRVLPRLADHWFLSPDGLVLRVRLREHARFHDGKPANAEMIRQVLEAQLPQDLGPLFDDIASIRAVSDREIEFALRRRSSFLLERLDTPLQEPGNALVGTGPFYVASQNNNQIEMLATVSPSTQQPSVDRIVIKPYASVRSAWADLLRGQLDMLYDVGVDALDSLQSSNEVKVFTFQRGYAYLLMLNFQKPYLRDAEFRRQLNAAIDRDEIVRDVLRGHGTPADGVVWPHHWAYSADLPRFGYQPRVVDPAARRKLVCIFNEPSYERLALVVQKQLQAIGVDLDLKLVSGSELLPRLTAGDFDLFLSDFVQGPTLGRTYLYWHSKAPYNFGRFNSSEVDNALDDIRDASDDTSYKRSVAAFQRAVVDDPPAVFLAWRERARVLSRRYEVRAEPNVDILTALNLWRPAPDERTARSN
jgi:peptide/nickel transport system substrate-binding protein